ncbi:hypothetical protein MmiEs2_05040 [Methanimicrococcus stummii]|uniref:Uncharacterized protein n=1 Tax=Methanimicrococcus stummii TaxID=3028294 RepID=A0AA96V836_9EURY|nr:hypothetical protein [Methanimicrococcus sp. Es2]WNY28319.1 hypothetical protein MmiEs2_05040 [Methanimicrococcus sp. Es2]
MNTKPTSASYTRTILTEDFELVYFRELYEMAKSNAETHKKDREYHAKKEREESEAAFYWEQAASAIMFAVPEVIDILKTEEE